MLPDNHANYFHLHTKELYTQLILRSMLCPNCKYGGRRRTKNMRKNDLHSMLHSAVRIGFSISGRQVRYAQVQVCRQRYIRTSSILSTNAIHTIDKTYRMIEVLDRILTAHRWYMRGLYGTYLHVIWTEHIRRLKSSIGF